MDRTSQDCLSYLGLCFYCSIIYFLFLEQTLAQSYVFVIVSDGMPTPMLYGPYIRPNEKPQGFYSTTTLPARRELPRPPSANRFSVVPRPPTTSGRPDKKQSGTGRNGKGKVHRANVQSRAKLWSLGCVNSRPVARGSQEAGFGLLLSPVV